MRWKRSRIRKKQKIRTRQQSSLVKTQGPKSEGKDILLSFSHTKTEMKTFEELHCRQKAKDLSTNLYAHFSNIDDGLFRELICSPCLEMWTHIAVGHGKSIKENTAYLVLARGASARLRCMLHIAKELDYIDDNTFAEYYNESLDIAKMLSWLIKAIKQKPADNELRARGEKTAK